MKHVLFGCIFLFVFTAQADFLDQVDIYVNGAKIWNTSGTNDGKDFFTDSLNVGDTLRIHAYTDWSELSLSRLLVHDMNGKKIKELPRESSRVYGAEFTWILSETDFQQELKISLDYNSKGQSDWWFATLTNAVFVRRNLLNQELYDAEMIWDSVRVKATWFQDGATESANLEDIPDDFAKFYEKFVRDSSFQKSHIAFSQLIGVEGLCDTTIRLNQFNVHYNDWDFTKFFDHDNHIDDIDGWANYIFYAEDRFYYEFRLKEIGMIYQTGFEKIDGEWQLTLYFANEC